MPWPNAHVRVAAPYGRVCVPSDVINGHQVILRKHAHLRHLHSINTRRNGLLVAPVEGQRPKPHHCRRPGEREVSHTGVLASVVLGSRHSWTRCHACCEGQLAAEGGWRSEAIAARIHPAGAACHTPPLPASRLHGESWVLSLPRPFRFSRRRAGDNRSIGYLHHC